MQNDTSGIQNQFLIGYLAAGWHGHALRCRGAAKGGNEEIVAGASLKVCEPPSEAAISCSLPSCREWRRRRARRCRSAWPVRRPSAWRRSAPCARPSKQPAARSKGVKLLIPGSFSFGWPFGEAQNGSTAPAKAGVRATSRAVAIASETGELMRVMSSCLKPRPGTPKPLPSYHRQICGCEHKAPLSGNLMAATLCSGLDGLHGRGRSAISVF